MGQRPREFWLNGGHPLARGLVLAGLGRHAKTTHYRDSSTYGNHGTLTNMDPATDWVWDDYLQRWCCNLDGADEQIVCSGPTISADFTLGLFVNLNTTAGLQSFIDQWATGAAGRLDWLMSSVTRKQLVYIGGSARGVGATELTAGVWNHLAISRFGAVINYYLNGRLDNGTAGSDSTAIVQTVLRIGSYTSGQWLNGRVADPCAYNRALSLAEIKILANPADPMLGGLILPPRRRLWPGVAAGGATTTINCTCGAVVIAGLASTVSVGTTIGATTGAVTIAGQSAAVSVGTTIDCTCGAAVVAGVGAAVVQGATINCTLGELTIAGLAASVDLGVTVDCTLGTLAIAGLNASVSVGTTIDCTLGTIAIAGLPVVVDLGLTINCTLGAVVIAGQNATVSVGTTIDCTIGALVVAGLNADINLTGTTTINCTLGAIVLAALNATVSQGNTITCSKGALVIAGLKASMPLSETADGLDYTVGDRRLHYSVADNRLHYKVTDNRPHFGV